MRLRWVTRLRVRLRLSSVRPPRLRVGLWRSVPLGRVACHRIRRLWALLLLLDGHTELPRVILESLDSLNQRRRFTLQTSRHLLQPGAHWTHGRQRLG